MTKLKADMASPEVKAEVEKSEALAKKMGVNGTPHFLIGDRAIAGAPEDLYDQLAEERRRAEQAGLLLLLSFTASRPAPRCRLRLHAARRAAPSRPAAELASVGAGKLVDGEQQSVPAAGVSGVPWAALETSWPSRSTSSTDPT